MKQSRCPLTDEWIKKLWYIFTMEYNSALESEFESVLLRSINLEPALQSEVNQKAENKYLILIHMYGMLKNSTNGPTFRAATDTQTYKTDLWTQQGK